MGNSNRYFKLSSDILLEYVYTDINPKPDGNCDDQIDIRDHRLQYVTDNYNGMRYIFSSEQNDVFDNKDGLTHNSVGNLVLPINRIGTKFVKVVNRANSNKKFWGANSLGQISEGVNVDISNLGSNTDLFYDTVVLHMTGRNYWGSYASFIIQAEINDYNGNPINVASVLFKKTDFVELDENPLFINQKVYTTHITFRIPSVAHLMTEPKIVRTFSPNGYSKLEAHTPIKFNLIGVKNSIVETTGYEYFVCETVNSISIPCHDRYGDVKIDVREASDGDYFILTPCTEGGKSFSDFMCNIDDNPGAYIIMHDVSLIEYWVDVANNSHEEITHREYYIINIEDAVSDEGVKKLLDKPMTYRPVCMYANMDLRFVVEDTLKILNTLDNTTVTKKMRCSCANPRKYGKKLSRLNLGDTPAQVNVYNKRTDLELDSVLIHNSKGNELTVENHQYDIQEFIECINIGVSVQSISSEDVE